MQYIISNYSHHTVHYIPMTNLSDNWKFVPFDPLNLFVHLPLPASDNYWSSLCIYKVGCFLLLLLLLFCFLDSTYK